MDPSGFVESEYGGGGTGSQSNGRNGGDGGGDGGYTNPASPHEGESSDPSNYDDHDAKQNGELEGTRYVEFAKHNGIYDGSSWNHTEKNKNLTERYLKLMETYKVKNGRIPGVVYVTKHRVFGVGPYHTALEYTDLDGATNVASAGPNKEGLLHSDIGPGGYGADSDLPQNNTTLGTVSPPDGLTSEDYFDEITNMDANYCDCLTYPLDGSVFSDMPNSNSYTATMVDVTGGITDVDFGSLFGGNDQIDGTSFDDNVWY